MRKIALKSLLSLLVVVAIIVGFVPTLPTANAATSVDSYYTPITAVSGTQLLAQLHDLITSTHTHYTSYAECGSSGNKTHVAKSDPGSNSNYLVEFYTQEDIALNSFDVPGGWNREHVWPKANSNGLWSSSTVGGGADLHHIRPAEKDLNNARGNLKYGEVTDGTAKYASGSNALGGYANSTTFEPLDNVKGDVARILFYVYTHYNNYSNSIFGGYAKTNGNGNSSYFGTLNFTNNVTASSESAAIAMLLEWNRNDPVDEIETTRNDYVATLTGNRNPFIDNPNFADAIWGGSSLDSDELIGLSLFPSSLTLSVGQTSTLSVVATPSNANAEVVWSTSNSNIVFVSAGLVTGKAEGTATVTATSKSNSSIVATAQITVRSLSSISVSGTPTKTYYHAGDEFDPSGLSVTAEYSDGTSENIPASSCLWLDATTNATTLSAGCREIVCKFGNASTTFGVDISVEQFVGQSFTIDLGSFVNISGSYGLYNWSSDGISGTAYIYGGNQTAMQLNSSKSSHFFASATPVDGGIKSVTIVLADGSNGFDWELWTSKSAYDSTNVESGTSHGVLSANTSGVTWNIDSDDLYFSLNYVGKGVTYVKSITVEYGSAGTVTHDSVSLDKSSVSLEVGESATITATATGTVSWTSSDSSVATVKNGVVTAVGKGTATVTATCGTATATCTVTVTEATPIDSVSLDKSSVSLEVGESATITATATGTVSWTSSDSSVATVQNGVVTAVGKGTATVTATCGTATATCTVTVTEKVEEQSYFFEFVDAVNAISSVKTMEEKFNAIKNALEVYGKLSPSDLSKSAEVYNVLQNAISNYNTAASDKNNQMNGAIQWVLGKNVLSALLLGTVVLLLKRKF